VVADLDGDGRKDLLSGNTNGQLVYYLNLGTDETPDFASVGAYLTSGGSPIDLLGTPRSRPFLGDWNADGQADLLVGAGDGRVHLFPGLDTTVAAPDAVPPVAVEMLPPWPNPANPRVTVAFVLGSDATVVVSIWDVRGRHVADLARGPLPAGRHAVTWDGRDRHGYTAASGTYLARVQVGGQVVARKLVLAR
jgi:hypothetical protein